LTKEWQRQAVDPLASESDEEYPAGFKAWVMVSAASLDPDRLVAALKAGDYYTSQGPVIHDIRLSDDGTSLQIANSPAVAVFVSGRPARVVIGGRHGAQITHSTFPLRQHAGSYVRVTVVDAAGKRAWSNPIWLD
jgi:hypothetical protein